MLPKKIQIYLVFGITKKVDELDVCELKACSFSAVHGRVTELSYMIMKHEK